MYRDVKGRGLKRYVSEKRKSGIRVGPYLDDGGP